ncbi:MbnP family protein [Putridiphycobacter roseus]|nr:MbnP family protein [Putridiphycobacter roseus]
MKIHTLIKILPIFILLLSSCKKLKEKKLATLKVNFQTELNQNNFDLTGRFADAQNRQIQLELVKFYLSDLIFVNDKGEEVPTDEIVLIELDMNGKASFETKIEAGTYTAFKFGVGVPKALNESDPSIFADADHPLNSTNNTYWGMNSMYRFVMIDGRFFDENDVFVGTFSYHTGRNESYRNVELVKTMTFDKKANHEETIFIDVAKILEGSGGNLDIEEHSNYHGNTEDFYLSEQLSDNFQQVFRFKN